MRTLAEIAELVNGDIIGDRNITIKGIAGITEVQEGDITLAIDKKNLDKAEKTNASAIIVSREFTNSAKTLIVVDNPRFAFAKLLQYFAPPKKIKPGIHPTAVIAQDVQLGEQVYIGPNVTIADGAVIGNNTVIMPGVYIGDGVSIGDNTVIHPNAVIEAGTKIGSRVIIHAGTVVGSDGYGFVFADGKHVKVPQVGTVVIEDDVEIGANVAIDRATSGSTVIKQGTKIDNLVHIAHNVVVGEHCLIVAQVGIAGSAKLEKYVTLAGQSGVVGHVNVGEKTVLAAKSVIMGNVPANSFLMGHPAREMSEEMKVKAATRKTPELLKAVKGLQKKVEELEANLSGREN